MIKSRLGTDFDAVVHRLLPFLVRLRVTPDTLTLLGVAFSAVAGLLFASGAPFAAAWPLGLAGAFDLVDGVVARAQGTSSRAGAFLDSAMDRVSDVVVLGGIAYGMAISGDRLSLAVAIWALGASVLTSYTRARAEQHLTDFRAGWMERGERLIVLILGALSGWLAAALWIVAIGATLTSLQRIRLARRRLAELDRRTADPGSRPPTRAPAGEAEGSEA
ncbi:MAG: CDP-alcohol phosphatidyltransferase family protein [Myxococcota bacterium]